MVRHEFDRTLDVARLDERVRRQSDEPHGHAFGHPTLDRWCEATETKQGGGA